MTECRDEALKAKLTLHLSNLWEAKTTAEVEDAHRRLTTENYFCDCDQCRARETFEALGVEKKSQRRRDIEQVGWITKYKYSRLVFNKDKKSRAMRETMKEFRDER